MERIKIKKHGHYKRVSKPAYDRHYKRLGYEVVEGKQEDKVDFEDLEMKAGGHYYYDGEYIAHGEQSAREKLAELNGGD